MRAAPFSAQGSGARERERGGSEVYWPEKGGGGEPRSVLDCRRSPSPAYSTSTLSSSLGGAAGSSDSIGVAAVSENSAAEATKWAADGGGGGGGGGGRKEEWGGGELAPMPGALDVGLVGVESWDAMLGDAAAAAGQEQTFLNWIMGGGDMEEAAALGIKPAPLPMPQQLVGGGGGHNAGFGYAAMDSLGFSLEHLGGISSPALASDLSSSGGARSLTSSSGSNSKASTFGLFSPEGALAAAPPPPQGMLFQDGVDTKPQTSLLGPSSLLLNPHQQQPPPPAAAFYMPLPSYSDHPLRHHNHHQQQQQPPPPKRHHPMSPTAPAAFPDDLFLLRNQLPTQQGMPFPQLHSSQAPFHLQPPPRNAMKSKAAMAVAADHTVQQQQMLDQLAEAAKAAEAGNSIGAREILARLNHQLPPAAPSPPLGKPFLRSASYLKEALFLALADHIPRPPPPPLTSPLDVALKLAAYKSFSDLSPVLQFANFTATQALLDEIACTATSCIHVVDFDLGVGGQWASFMQELAHRRGTGAGGGSASAVASAPMLKVTAFVSAASHHPLELHLTRDNLSQFAADLRIPFEFNAVCVDSFDPTELIAPSSNEVVAVSLPVGCSARGLPLLGLLRLVKQLSPKIVVAIDHGGDRGDLPFSQHFLNCFQSCMFLLDSLDAAGADADAASKIERFLIQPRVEDAVLGRRRADKAMAWRRVFASAGFVPTPLSNLAEAQADCLLKRVQLRGFHVEKSAPGLALYWQNGELVSVSAWRC